MAALLFVLFWIVLGLAILWIGLAGGRDRSQRIRPAQARRNRKVGFAVFGLAVIVLGAGVPAAVIATVQSRDSIPNASVANLTPAEEHGRQLFGQRCRTCHTLQAAAAYAQVGPNLDELRPPYALVLDAIRRGRARGNGNMAANLVTGEDQKDVAAFVAKAVGQAVPGDTRSGS
jgi:mono/diheme cytochrome c family protein